MKKYQYGDRFMEPNSVNRQMINKNIAYYLMPAIAILILVGCTSRAPKTQSNDKVTTQTLEKESNVKTAITEENGDNDTLVVKGKSVVFFSITNLEYDSLLKNDAKANEMDEVLSDFYHYSNILVDTLNKTGIKCSISSKPIYKIVNDNGGVTIFSKTGKEQIVGAIMTDGKQNPKYHFGVATDVDYFSIISDYFNKK